MKIPFNKKWIIWEKEDYANYLFVVPAWEGFTYKNPEFGFQNFEWLSAEYINKECNLFSPLDIYTRLSKKYLESIFINPGLWDKLHRENIYFARETLRLADRIKKIKVYKLADRELLKWLEKFKKIQMENHVRRGPMFTVEVKYNLFSNYLMEYLKERCQDLKLKNSILEAFRILTTPIQQSIIKKQQLGLIKIVLIKNKKRQCQALRRHTQKYEWLEYGLQGKILDENYFKKELTVIKKRGAQKLLKKVQREILELRTKQKETIKKLKIDRHHQRLFKIARDSIYCKVFSKDAQFYSYYATENLFKELGRRSGLTLEQIRFLTFDEYREIILKEKNFSKIATERMRYSLHFAQKGKTLIYWGKAAKRVRKKLKFIKEEISDKNQKELRGNPAYPGKVVGKVKIINTVQEMMKMHESNILVSHMTNPDIVPAMKLAAAIVTDLGGITCHAAIVSRELNVPCVIGTKIASRILKDGDLVEVDAIKGIVKKL